MHDLLRRPLFFQRILEGTGGLLLIVLLPIVEGRWGISAVIGMALVLVSFVVPWFKRRPSLLLIITLAAAILIAVAVPPVPLYTYALHLLVYVLVARNAPSLKWLQALLLSVLLEPLYQGTRAAWTFNVASWPSLVPGTVLDLAGMLILAVGSKHWEELNQAVREAAVKLSAVMGSSFDVIMIVDRTGRVRSANTACLHVLGYDPAELTDRPLAKINGASTRDLTQQIHELLTLGSRVIGLVDQAVRKDGSVAWMTWNLTPIPELEAVLFVGREVKEAHHPEG